MNFCIEIPRLQYHDDQHQHENQHPPPPPHHHHHHHPHFDPQKYFSINLYHPIV